MEAGHEALEHRCAPGPLGRFGLEEPREVSGIDVEQPENVESPFGFRAQAVAEERARFDSADATLRDGPERVLAGFGFLGRHVENLPPGGSNRKEPETADAVLPSLGFPESLAALGVASPPRVISPKPLLE